MNNPQSNMSRTETLKQIKSGHFDLLIIGGGITGAGVALDAASRGMKVALVEKGDFASGTSSKSTKLIHGGLRYLKQFEFGLVKEVGTERAIVHQIAPHLVIPEKMLLPLVEGGSLGKISTSIGLAVYDFLAGVKNEDRFKMLSKTETLLQEPLLNNEKLKGSSLYAEYRTDDARLTIENIKTAASNGALCINYAQATDFLYQKDKVCGAKCIHLPDGQQFDIRARFVVNAAGPWTDQLRKKDHSLNHKHLFLTKGIHLVLPFEKIPVHQSVYFDVGDGRMIFAIPRLEVVYVGTTDTPHKTTPDSLSVSKTDVNYLLEAVNRMFSVDALTEKDVLSSWAGLRPLIFEEGKSASEISRKDELFESKSGLVSIAGGKLTGYRKMAERTVDLVTRRYAQHYNHTYGPAITHKILLHGGPFTDFEDVISYKKGILNRLTTLSLPHHYADYLVHNYGRQSDIILDRMPKNFPPEIALTRAEARFSIIHEMALYPLDFLARRSGRLYFFIQSIPSVAEDILQIFAEANQWDNETLEIQRKLIWDSLKKVVTFT